jgi:hypothetical protein
MSYHNLEDLEVYQLAESFGNEVWFIVHDGIILQKILSVSK